MPAHHRPEAALSQPPRFFPLAEAQGRAFLVTRYREPVHHFLWHYHPETELVWVRRGGGLRYIGESVESFQAGDLVLLGRDVPHTWSSGPEHAGTADWTVIQFQPEQWGQAFWHLPELQPCGRLLARAEVGLQFTGPGRWQAGRQMEALARLRPHSFGSLVDFLQLLTRLLRLPVRPLNPQPAAIRKTASENRFDRALDLIHRRVGDPLTQAEVAARVGLSPAAFSRWFKQRSGRVFQRYVNEVRVAHVCAHLAAGVENVTEAAGACGYNSLANFYRRFREITGLSPREFRRLNEQTRQQRTRELVVRLGRRGALRIAPSLGSFGTLRIPPPEA
jgi:AraC-like DNA-binding protein